MGSCGSDSNRCRSVGPATNGMTKKRNSPSLPDSSSGRMTGCWRRERIPISRWKRSRPTTCWSRGSSTLMATTRPASGRGGPRNGGRPPAYPDPLMDEVAAGDGCGERGQQVGLNLIALPVTQQRSDLARDCASRVTGRGTAVPCAGAPGASSVERGLHPQLFPPESGFPLALLCQASLEVRRRSLPGAVFPGSHAELGPERVVEVGDVPEPRGERNLDDLRLAKAEAGRGLPEAGPQDELMRRHPGDAPEHPEKVERALARIRRELRHGPARVGPALDGPHGPGDAGNDGGRRPAPVAGRASVE